MLVLSYLLKFLFIRGYSLCNIGFDSSSPTIILQFVPPAPSAEVSYFKFMTHIKRRGADTGHSLRCVKALALPG